VAWQPSDPPAIDRLAGFGNTIADLAFAFLHAEADLQLVLHREVLELHGLAWPDADARKLGADFLLVLLSGRKLQRKIEIVEEVPLHQLLIDLRKVDGWRGQRRRLVQVGGQ